MTIGQLDASSPAMQGLLASSHSTSRLPPHHMRVCMSIFKFTPAPLDPLRSRLLIVDNIAGRGLEPPTEASIGFASRQRAKSARRVADRVLELVLAKSKARLLLAHDHDQKTVRHAWDAPNTEARASSDAPKAREGGM